MAANQLGIARPDGLTIGTFNSGLFYSQLQGNDGLKTDLRKVSWIGKAATTERVLVVPARSDFQTIEAMQAADRTLLFGASAIGSAARNEALILRHLLGIPISIVTGFSGNDSQMSLMRGEIDGAFGSYSSYRAFLDRGDGRVLLTVGDRLQIEEIMRLVPNDVASDQARELLSLIDSVATLGRLTAAPPNVPDERLDVLRLAYERTLSDPELLAEARRGNLPVAPMSGEEVAIRARAILGQSVEMRALVARLTQPESGR